MVRNSRIPKTIHSICCFPVRLSKYVVQRPFHYNCLFPCLGSFVEQASWRGFSNSRRKVKQKNSYLIIHATLSARLQYNFYKEMLFCNLNMYDCSYMDCQHFAICQDQHGIYKLSFVIWGKCCISSHYPGPRAY